MCQRKEPKSDLSPAPLIAVSIPRFTSLLPTF